MNLSTSLAHNDFAERLCLVRLSNTKTTDVAVASGNELAANQLWPALTYNSHSELQDQIEKDIKLKSKINLEYVKFIRENPNKKAYGIAYLLGREKSQSTLVFVPKNSEGEIGPDNHNVFSFWDYVEEMTNGTGYCGSVQFQAAYNLVMNRLEQDSSPGAQRRIAAASSLPDDDSSNATAAPSKDVQDDTSPRSPPGVNLQAVLHQPFSKQNQKSSGFMKRVFGGFLRKKLFHQTTVDTKETSVAKITPPRCDTEHQVGSPPIEETNDTTVFSDRVDRSPYADDSAAVVNPADKDVDSIIGEKRKRGRSRQGSRQKRNKSKAKKVVGGCRMIPSSMLATSLSSCVDNEPRECLLRAILPLLVTLSDQEKNRVALSIRRHMPKEGDTSIGTANRGLSEHGLRLESVTEEYRMKGGIIFNLLQKESCKLVIKLRLSSPRWKDDNAHHFIGFDGGELYDDPHPSARLHRNDRVSRKSCHAVFKALFPVERFSNFDITNVYELLSISGEGSMDIKRRGNSSSLIF